MADIQQICKFIPKLKLLSKTLVPISAHLLNTQQKKNALKYQNFHSGTGILVLYHHDILDHYGTPCTPLVYCTFLPIQPKHEKQIIITPLLIQYMASYSLHTYFISGAQLLKCISSHKGNLIVHELIELLFRVVKFAATHTYTYSSICSYIQVPLVLHKYVQYTFNPIIHKCTYIYASLALYLVTLSTKFDEQILPN